MDISPPSQQVANGTRGGWTATSHHEAFVLGGFRYDGHYYFPLVGVQTIAISVSACLFVCLFVFPLAYLKNTRPNFTKFSADVICGRRSFFLWRQCNMLCRPTSGFVDDVMFSTYHMMERLGHNRRLRVCLVQFAKWRYRRRSLTSPTASCYVVM